MIWETILGFLKVLVDPLAKLFTALFLVKQGEKNNELEHTQEELKDVKKINDIKSNASRNTQRNRKLLADKLAKAKPKNDN